MDIFRLEAYWNDIPNSVEEAATYDQLKHWWHVDKRGVRNILQELSGFDNGDNFVLIRTCKNKGFYKTEDIEAITAYKQECLNKGRSIFAPVKKINRVLKATNQFSLMNNMRLTRETLNIKQKDVVEYMQQFDEHFDVPMLSKMENGVCLPTPFQLAKLSDYYKCEPSQLIQTTFYY